MRRSLTMVFIAVLLCGPLIGGRAFALSTATPKPTMRPSVQFQVRDLKTLSNQERLSLPDSTNVTLGAHTVSLGELRRTHAALVASRSRVKSMNFSSIMSSTGANHSFSKVYGVSQNKGGVTFKPTPTPSAGHTTTYPIKSVNPNHYNAGGQLLQPATVPLVAAANGHPSDYEQFCKSVPATVCLFYPQGVTWYGQDGNNFWTIDYLVTDASVCSQEGGFIGYETGWGQLNGDGCIYEYPATQTVNFVPPAAGFKTSGWCNQSMFTSVVDSPHGAVQVSDNGAHNQSVEEFCFLQVTLNH